jgi:hypothetical protein
LPPSVVWQHRLPPVAGLTIVADMFVVSEADAAAIRAAFEQQGKFAAAVELRRLFPGVTDMAEARERQAAVYRALPGARSHVTAAALSLKALQAQLSRRRICYIQAGLQMGSMSQSDGG